MNHDAIREIYPNAMFIEEKSDGIYVNGNLIEIDSDRINQAEITIQSKKITDKLIKDEMDTLLRKQAIDNLKARGVLDSKGGLKS